MIRYIFNITAINLCCLLCFSACNSWLEVDPSDKVLDKTIFATEPAINTALNGIYMKMATDKLYGGAMTMTTVEILSLQYYINASATPVSRYNLTQYKYTDKDVQTHTDALWQNLYNAILNVNIFIATMDGNNVLETSKKDIVLGEAHALRAFLHFDLLRLFGPVYSIDSTSLSIPYYTQANMSVSPLLPANKVMQMIYSDLDKALIYLKNDPILTNGVMNSSLNDPKVDFYRYRNMRLNYYACLALRARILMYQGNTVAASTQAKEVIAKAAKYFPPTPKAEVTSGHFDRRFSKEVLFAVENINLVTTWYKLHLGATQLSAGLFILNDNVKKTFDLTDAQDLIVSTDYRASGWRLFTSVGDVLLRLPYKFANESGVKPAAFVYQQPLIRMSEMYYIVAEADNDLTPLNTMRSFRGLADLDETVPKFSLIDEISKEYTREMYGEGQLFFFYKRINKAKIPDGEKAKATRNMQPANYVLPLPEDELANQKKN